MSASPRGRQTLRIERGPLIGRGIVLPGVAETPAGSPAAEDNHAGVLGVEGRAVPLARGRSGVRVEPPPSVGVEVESPEIPQRAGTGTAGATAVEQHLIVGRVVNGVVQTAPQRTLVRGNLRPGVSREIELPGVVEPARAGEAMGDHHAVARGIENRRMPIAPVGNGAVGLEQRPGVRGDVVDPNIVEEPAGLPAEDHQPAAPGVEHHGVAEPCVRRTARRGQFHPAGLVQRIGPQVVAEPGSASAEDVEAAVGWIVHQWRIDPRRRRGRLEQYRLKAVDGLGLCGDRESSDQQSPGPRPRSRHRPQCRSTNPR